MAAKMTVRKMALINYIENCDIVCVHPFFLSAVRDDDSATDNSCDEAEDANQSMEQKTEFHKLTSAFLHDSLNKAAFHLRRAMVLLNCLYRWWQ